MRKNYFLKSAVWLLCSIFLWSCSKDDNSEKILDPEENQTLLSVTLGPNYFPEPRNVEYSGAVYLTNEEGEVIADGELKNGNTTELEGVYDLTNEKLNLSFIIKIKLPDEISYRISTYTDVDPYEFSFDKLLNMPLIEEATVHIRNTGSHLQHFIFNTGYTGSVSRNEATFEISLREDPSHLFFTVKNEDENFKRYFMQKDFAAGTSVSREFEELPQITNQLNIKFPENSSLFTSIRGAESTEPNNFYAGIDQIRDLDGRTSHTFVIPEDLFERYNLRMILDRDQKQYLLDEKTTSINEEYAFPDWDLQSSSSGTEYSLTSTNEADYYTAGFQYVPADQPYDIVWSVTGKKSDEMNFNLPNLQEFITQDSPDFNLDDLYLRSASLDRIEGISNYKDFIIAQEDNFSSENEAITKYENLITFF